MVVTHAEHHDAFLADRDTWLAAITPTVFAATPDRAVRHQHRHRRGAHLRHRRCGPARRPSGRRRPCATPSACCRHASSTSIGAALEYAVAEQLRGMAGPFISLSSARSTSATSPACPHLLGLLTTVFLAETGAVPPGKHWNGAYTEEQRAAGRGAPAGRAPPARASSPSASGSPSSSSRRARPLYPATTSSGPPTSPGSPPTACRSSSASTSAPGSTEPRRRSSPSTGSASGPAGPGTSTSATRRRRARRPAWSSAGS